MQEMIISFMNRFGYFGIALLIAVENIFPPIPSEVILTFGGFMTTYSKLHITGVIIASTVGSLLGALILYWIGKLLNKEKLMRLIDSKIGKWLRLKKEDIEKADQWFGKKGSITVFVCRFVPIVRSLISIPAGMNGMKIQTFLILTTIGTLIWNAVLTVLGASMGSAWPKIVEFMNRYSKFGFILLLIAFFIGVFIFYKKRLGKTREK